MKMRHSASEQAGWSGLQWLLGAFFIGSGLAAWWLFAPPVEDGAETAARERRPDYVISQLTAVETDAAGQPTQRLVAEELRQFVSEDVTELDQPRLTLYSGQGQPWQARADRGQVMPGGDEIQLAGRVRMQRAASEGHPEARMETELIHIRHASAFAQTDQPVRISSEEHWITATGMRLWYAEPVRAEFTGRPHIFIAPSQNEAP